MDRLAKDLARLRQDVDSLLNAPPQLPHSTIDVAGEPVLLPAAVGDALEAKQVSNEAKQQAQQAKERADQAQEDLAGIFTAEGTLRPELVDLTGVTSWVAQPTAPTDTDVLWYDTSQTPPVGRLWLGGQWVEIGADVQAELDALGGRIDGLTAPGGDVTLAINDATANASLILKAYADTVSGQARADALADAEAYSDSKPTQIHSTVTPSGVYPVGSLWYRHGKTNPDTGAILSSGHALSDPIVGQWVRVASGWASMALTGLVLTQINVGTGVIGRLKAANIDFDSMAGNSAFIAMLDTLNLTATRVLIRTSEGEVRVLLEGDGEDAVQIVEPGGDVVASISSDGAVTGRTLSAAESIRYQGNELSGLLGAGRVVTRYHSVMGAPVETVLASWLRVVSVSWVALPGLLYEVDFGGLQWGATQVGMRCATKLVYGVGTETTPSMPSPDAAPDDSWLSPAAENNSDWWTSGPLRTSGRFATGATGPRIITATVCIRRTHGTGYIRYHTRNGDTTQQKRIGLKVHELGSYYDAEPGVGHYEGSVPGSAPPAPPSQRTHQFYATGFRSYMGNGQPFSGSGPAGSYPIQGYTTHWPAGGTQRSVIMFDHAHMRSVLSGAQIVGTRVRLKPQHFYSSAGGTLRLHHLNHPSLPSTQGQIAGNHIGDYGMRVGDPVWLNVGAWLGERFRDGSSRNLALDSRGSTSGTYYGYIIGTGDARPVIEVTYIK
jgi:hypothetical protein